MNIQLVRVEFQKNLFIIGKAPFWKNLLNRKMIHLEDFFFVDFIWNKNTGAIEQIYLNSPSVIKSLPNIEISRNKVIFSTAPDFHLEEMYMNMLDNIRQQRELL